MCFADELKKAITIGGIELSGGQMEQFCHYYELLIEENKKINLTALTTAQDVAVKHFVDSLSAYDENVFRTCKKVVDIGSGAGFPGIPLKIFDDKLEVVLLDSLGKRIKFLKKVVDELKLNDVKCVHGRAEDAAREEKMREKFDVAVVRAVAPLNIVLEYSLPFVKIGGNVVALKGQKVWDEIKESQNAVKILGGENVNTREIKLPMCNETRIIVTINKTKTTPKQYPRKAGTPTKKPLR